MRLSIAGGLNGNRKEQSGSYLSGLSTELVGDLRWEPVVVLLARLPPSEGDGTGLPAQHHPLPVWRSLAGAAGAPEAVLGLHRVLPPSSSSTLLG